jgi:protein TonB
MSDTFAFEGDALEQGRLRNWSACFAVVLAMHVGVFLIALHWIPRDRSVQALPPPMPAAMMIDLAPLPASPSLPPSRNAPSPKQAILQPSLKPEVQLPLLPAPPSPAPHIAVPMPPQIKLKPLHHQRPALHALQSSHALDRTAAAPASMAPPQLTAAKASAAAAMPSVLPAMSPNVVASWQALLLGRLERFKRYPDEAQLNQDEGTAYLRFTMDRQGKVLSAAIEKSSGYAELDRETLALIYRAEPLPPPPPGIGGDPIELTVPVQFSLHQ